MGEEWSRLVNATINRYVRAEERSILRSRRLVALLQREGRLLTLKTDHDHQRVKDWVRGIAHELDTAIRMAQEQDRKSVV